MHYLHISAKMRLSAGIAQMSNLQPVSTFKLIVTTREDGRAKQNYLKRLVINEGNFSEQVEDRKQRYNMTERLEEIENEAVETDETADIEYEGEEELESDLNGNCYARSSYARWRTN